MSEQAQGSSRSAAERKLSRASDSGLLAVLSRNIRTLEERREQEQAVATRTDRLADAITRFAGSMGFVALHLGFFGLWLLNSLGLVPGLPSFDPSLVGLATFASVEAIFLSTFVLISQNRMAATADKRAELDLQVNLLAEHEVTKLIALVAAIADRLDVSTPVEQEIGELQQDLSPEAVLDEIDSQQDETSS